MQKRHRHTRRVAAAVCNDDSNTEHQQDAEPLVEIDITSSAPDQVDQDMFEVFGLSRSQVKYSTKEARTQTKEQVQMPFRIRDVHMHVAAAAKADLSVPSSSRSKGKEKLL